MINGLGRTSLSSRNAWFHDRLLRRSAKKASVFHSGCSYLMGLPFRWALYWGCRNWLFHASGCSNPWFPSGGPHWQLQQIRRLSDETFRSASINLIRNFLNRLFKNVSKNHFARYLTGTLGIYTIKAIADHMSGKSVNPIVSKFKELVDVVVQPGYQPYGDDEILNGRAGFLAGVLTLRYSAPIYDC